MTLVRPGPSPAAPGGEASRPRFLQEGCGVAGEGDEVEDRVEAVEVALARGCGEVAVAGQQLADAELAQAGLVFGQRRGDDGGAGAGGELDGDAADAAGRADDQHRVAVGLSSKGLRVSFVTCPSCPRSVDGIGNSPLAVGTKPLWRSRNSDGQRVLTNPWFGEAGLPPRRAARSRCPVRSVPINIDSRAP
jgi:hypothetical protein